MVRTLLSATLVVLYFSVPLEHALPEVEQYHEAVSPELVPISPAELSLVDEVTAAFEEVGKTVPLYDPNITLACKQLCRVLDCTDMDAVQAWEPRTIQFTLRKFGITDSFYFPVIARVEAPEDAQELLLDLVSNELQSLGVNRFGLALDLEDSRMFAAVFTRRLAQLGPFPRSVEPGSTHLLWGALSPGVRNPVLILAMPDDGTLQTSPRESKDLFWNQLYFPDEPGEYLVELLVSQDGPQVANLFPVYVGVEPPRFPVFKIYPGVEETADIAALEGQVMGLLNREREKRQLKKCVVSRQLTESARAYSKSMARAARLSHALPRHDDATPSYTENISLSTSVTAAHANLMASPSHRRNIISSDARYCGVGVATVDKGEAGTLLYITQRFCHQDPARQPRQNSTP
jgi:hypothetical protein